MQGAEGAEDLGRLKQLWFCLARGWGVWSWHPSEDPGSWLSRGLSGATDLGSPLSESVVPVRTLAELTPTAFVYLFSPTSFISINSLFKYNTHAEKCKNQSQTAQ